MAPMKLIIDEIRIRATNEGFTQFHLGGGLGGSSEDSLFRFKSAFSNTYNDFYLWKYIVNKDTYDNIIQKSGITGYNEYFPLYRYKLQ